MSPNFKNIFRFDNLTFLLAILVFGVTAYNSHGWYYADEHYQIIEFAGIKTGTHTADDMAWEFNARLRSTVQPTLCYLIFTVLNAVHITDQYHQVFVLRLITAILALLVIRLFIKRTEHLFPVESDRKLYHLLSYFLWFIPFISVHFSSETWSGLLFMLSLVVFFGNSRENIKPFWLGIVFGLSFLFRYQLGFAILGFVLWMIFIHKVKWDYLLKTGISFLVIVFLGFCLDSWFYGETVFAPWNYLKSVLESKGSGFGTSPWYFYLKELIFYPTPVVGIPLLISFILLMIYQPKNLYLWCIIPFVIIHSLIPHKEDRFMFSIIYMLPVILTQGYVILRKIIRNKKAIKVFGYSLAVLFIIVNGTGLAVMSQKSAGMGRMEISRYIHKTYGDENTNLIYCTRANPYRPWHGKYSKYYMEPNMIDRHIQNLCELDESMFFPDRINLVVLKKMELQNPECSKKIEQYNLSFQLQSIPTWIQSINKLYRGFKDEDVVLLYRYEGKEQESR